MSTCDTPAGDFFLTINGFDELAITKQFGEDIAQLQPRPFTFLRALVFVHQRREGLRDAEAYKAAQELPISTLQDYFPDEVTDLDPDDPDSDAGKEPSASD